MSTASALQVELARSRLTATIAELTRLLHRSAYSTLMRESRDCSITLVSPRGEALVDGPDPFHGSSYRYLIEGVLERYGDDLSPGDVLLSNHPYQAGTPHSPDTALVVPTFVNGLLVGFCASLAHKSDFGGAVSGSASMRATHLFQEGLLLPIMRVATADEPELHPLVSEIIAANVRAPDLVFGDLHAQLGVTRVGAERLGELASRMGPDVLRSCFAQMLDQGEHTLRDAISSWPDGCASATGYLDNDGVDLDRPVRLTVHVEKAGDALTFDFTDCDDETAGPVNTTPLYTDAAVYYAVICSAIPDFGFNDGIRRVVAIRRRPGSVVDPLMPAPVGAATSTKYRLTDLCFEALGALAPETRTAHAGSASSIGFLWSAGDSRAVQYEVLGAAMGAISDADGASGVTPYHTNLSVTPIEVLESQYPVRVRRFELIPDSGGVGRTRGGLSYRREYEALRPASVSRKADKGRFPAMGVEGGGAGALAAVRITRSDGVADAVPVAGDYELEPGDVVTVDGSGGGGFGDPLSRPPEEVLADVRARRVSSEAAAELYGVVITDDLAIDEEATASIRRTAVAAGQHD